MKFGIVGYGKMGRAIEAAARERGHDVVWIVEGASAFGDASSRADSDAVFEFTRPEAARANVEALLVAGHSVVCGTTGWSVPDAFDRLATERGVAFLQADNFSLGVTWLRRLVASLAAWSGEQGEFTPWIHERHHAAKRDAPSGTARMLASTVAEADPRRPRAAPGETSPLPPGAFTVSANRAGHEPGTHTVGFDGPHESIELTHRARGRGGFASGAVVAAERLAGRVGRWTLDAVLDAGRVDAEREGDP